MSSKTDRITFGIRSKLFLPLLFGQLVIIGITLFAWLPDQLQKSKEEFIDDQTNLLKSLTPSLVQNILSNDLSSLHSILENSLKIHKKHWRYLELYNADKTKLFPIFGDKPGLTKSILEIKLNLEENDEYFGQLVLFSDWGLKKAAHTKETNNIIVILTILLGIIAAISYFFQTKWIYTPLTRLKDVTSQFSNGNYKTHLPTVSQDEIGSLTKSIDQMRDKINLAMSELVDSEKKQRAILDSVPDAIITINNKGEIQSFNPGAEKIFDYKADEVIGSNIKNLMPENFARHHDNYIDQFEVTSKSKNIGLNRELYATRKNGEEFPVDLTINAKIIDNELLFTGILRDITERKKIDRLKDEFISTVSHELRTPLTAIKGSIDLMIKGFNLDLPDEASTMLDVASRNVDRLLTLINDILDVSKLESGKIELFLENFELQSFIDECIELNQEYAKKHHTRLVCQSCNTDVVLNADKSRLSQVMSNLLSNASKYSPEDIPVEVSTEIINGQCRVSVRDHGPGIPEEFQPSLFEKFTQSSSGDTRQVGGTGLGLSISKTIIEMLGGHIHFVTKKGKGSTFYFDLPYQ